MSKKTIAVLAGLISLSLPSAVKASLAVSYQQTGNINWSLDGIGSNATPTGIVSAQVPVGSTILKAFLYSTTHRNLNDDPTDVGTFESVNFDGTTYNAAAFTALGVNPAFDGNFNNLQAYRVDVTSQVAAKIALSPATSLFNFNVLSEDDRGDIDGEVLAVIYSNSSESVRTIALFDGFSASTGDTFVITFPTPLPDTTAPGFEASFSLGIGFGTQPATPPQFSTVSVNGRLLTSSAGGQDDGNSTSGALITVGGLGDDPANPVDPAAPPTNTRTDDELYDLAKGNGVNPAPFLTTGSTTLRISTFNPSGNDNIFFAGINVTAVGTASVGTPLSSVPEPATALFGITLFASCGLFRIRRKNS